MYFSILPKEMAFLPQKGTLMPQKGENRLAPSHSACSLRIPHECLTILYPVSENVQDEKLSVDTLCQNTWQPD